MPIWMMNEGRITLSDQSCARGTRIVAGTQGNKGYPLHFDFSQQLTESTANIRNQLGMSYGTVAYHMDLPSIGNVAEEMSLFSLGPHF